MNRTYCHWRGYVWIAAGLPALGALLVGLWLPTREDGAGYDPLNEELMVGHRAPNEDSDEAVGLMDSMESLESRSGDGGHVQKITEETNRCSEGSAGPPPYNALEVPSEDTSFMPGRHTYDMHRRLCSKQASTFVIWALLVFMLGSAAVAFYLMWSDEDGDCD